MNLMELGKKYKSQLAIISTMVTTGGLLFAKIDAYAQGKVDTAVKELRQEANNSRIQLESDISIVKAEQQATKEQLADIKQEQKNQSRKQDKMMDVLLEMKGSRK